jgi:hypothetical protein
MTRRDFRKRTLAFVKGMTPDASFRPPRPGADQAARIESESEVTEGAQFLFRLSTNTLKDSK